MSGHNRGGSKTRLVPFQAEQKDTQKVVTWTCSRSLGFKLLLKSHFTWSTVTRENVTYAPSIDYSQYNNQKNSVTSTRTLQRQLSNPLNLFSRRKRKVLFKCIHNFQLGVVLGVSLLLYILYYQTKHPWIAIHEYRHMRITGIVQSETDVLVRGHPHLDRHSIKGKQQSESALTKATVGRGIGSTTDDNRKHSGAGQNLLLSARLTIWHDESTERDVREGQNVTENNRSVHFDSPLQHANPKHDLKLSKSFKKMKGNSEMYGALQLAFAKSNESGKRNLSSITKVTEKSLTPGGNTIYKHNGTIVAPATYPVGPRSNNADSTYMYVKNSNRSASQRSKSSSQTQSTPAISIRAVPMSSRSGKSINHSSGNVSKTGDRMTYNNNLNESGHPSTGRQIAFQSDQNYGKKYRLLVLFTTFKRDPSRFRIHCNVIKNWASFRPAVIPVLFNDTTNPVLVAMAKDSGWLIRQVPSYNKNRVPILSEMYKDLQSLNSITTFIGFANGDMLFDEGLVTTLEGVDAKQKPRNQIMVVGMRHNLFVKRRRLFWPHDVWLAVKNEALEAPVYAEDFFFIYQNRFPWHLMPELVIGRPAYDNYMVAVAIQNNVSVVDASQTLSSLHQYGPGGLGAGRNNPDAQYNRHIIGQFNFREGYLDQAPFETTFDPKGKIVVWERDKERQQLLNHIRRNNITSMWREDPSLYFKFVDKIQPGST